MTSLQHWEMQFLFPSDSVRIKSELRVSSSQLNLLGDLSVRQILVSFFRTGSLRTGRNCILLPAVSRSPSSTSRINELSRSRCCGAGHGHHSETAVSESFTVTVSKQRSRRSQGHSQQGRDGGQRKCGLMRCRERSGEAVTMVRRTQAFHRKTG